MTQPGPAARAGAADDTVPAPKCVDLLVLCTGNAARSVMAAYMVEHRGEAAGLRLRISSAGTHALAGQPMGLRTRAALAGVDELGELPVARHRSRELTGAEAARADLVVAMEADHVRYVRRHHPTAAPRTATIRRLCRDLAPGPSPLAGRVGALGLGSVPLEDWEDVADPAGGDDDTYRICAEELWELTGVLVELL